MPNKYPNQPLHERVLQETPRSPNSTRNRGRARNEAAAQKAFEAREEANEKFQLSKMKTLTKQHFRSARRKGTPIGWAEARGRAIEQLAGDDE